MAESQFVGQEPILSFFDKVIAAGNLSHAYCFVGPSQVGKRTLATKLAARILKWPEQKILSHPDFVFVARGEDEKTGKTKKNIDVDQMRELRGKLANRSLLGGAVVAIIDDAELMNQHAANALLKTLEEPKKGTVIFLVTEDEKAVPGTILSRCQSIRFKPVPVNAIKEALLQRNVAADQAEKVASLSMGRPGRAMKYVEAEAEYDKFVDELKRFLSLFGKTFHEKIKIVEDLFGDKTDAVANREIIETSLKSWLMAVRQMAGAEEDGEKIVSIIVGEKKDKLPSNKLFLIEELIVDAIENIGKNIHPRIILERILLQIP